jgi:hypothetical protein
MLGTTVVTAALVRGTLAIYFYVVHVRGMPPDQAPSYMTTHEDSLLFVAGTVLMLSWALERRKGTTWLGAGIVSALLFWAMVVNRRRLAWIELALALSFAYVLMPPSRLRRGVTRFLLLLALFLSLYVIVGRGRQEAIFEPLRAFSTSGSNEDSSSLARLEEIRNLLFTFSEARNPLLGTGWGRPYQKFTSIYANFDSTWRQYLYMPHNSLLGVAVFSGLVGLFGIWLVVPVTALVATRGYRRSTQAVDRAASMVALSILPAYGAHCYGDVGFQSLTCGLILGVAMAAAGKVPLGAAALGVGPRRARGVRVGRA